MQNIETEISEFDKHLRQKKVVADNTRIEYSRRARKFLSHINGQDICEPVILDYLEGLKKEGRCDKTINCYRDAISAYIDFRHLKIEHPPTRKLIRKIPDIIEGNDDEFFENEILPIAETIFDTSTCKVVALLYFVKDTILRPSSIEVLHRHNFDFPNKRGLYINVKGKKQKYFLLTNKAIKAIQIYFDSEEEDKNAFNLSRSGITRIFAKIRDALHKKSPHLRFRPYLFRHTLISRLLNAGMNESKVQEIAGHESVLSLAPYKNMNIDKIQIEYFNIMGN